MRPRQPPARFLPAPEDTGGPLQEARGDLYLDRHASFPIGISASLFPAIPRRDGAPRPWPPGTLRRALANLPPNGESTELAGRRRSVDTYGERGSFVAGVCGATSIFQPSTEALDLERANPPWYGAAERGARIRFRVGSAAEGSMTSIRLSVCHLAVVAGTSALPATLRLSSKTRRSRARSASVLGACEQLIAALWLRVA